MHFVIGDDGFGPIAGPSSRPRHMQFLLTLVIFWRKFLRILPYGIFPPLLYVVGIEASGHYILRFILFPPTSTPYHIDRFGATCSLHSQEDGKIPSARFSPSSCVLCNNALQRDGRRKLPWLHFQVLLGRSTVCTTINSVGLAGGAPCSGGTAQGPPCTFMFPACSRARSVLDHAPRQGLWPSLYSFCWCHQFLPFRSVHMSLLLFLGQHHQFLSDLFSTLYQGMGAEPRGEGQPLHSAFLFSPKDLVCLVGSVL